MIAYDPDPTGEERFVYGERHNCRVYPRCVYPCRACAQARVEQGPREWGDLDSRGGSP